MKKYYLYIVFAFLAVAINLGTQYVIKISNISANYYVMGYEFKFFIQLGAGTIAGFVFKFIVDKFIVFKNKHKNIKHTTRQAIIYTFFAVFTTIIFWSAEFIFKIGFDFSNSDLLGGLIGLLTGYTVKFILDRKWVFDNSLEER